MEQCYFVWRIQTKQRSGEIKDCFSCILITYLRTNRGDTLAKLPQGSDCHVDLRGTFADGQSMDASGVDVCAEKTLNLTD